ncbi:MAG: NusG domain II-containing protein [Lachnospiraceae bacterium]|nr:NusG domain II-containing protein [Lachnospiraceae bacterium]
MKFGRADAVLAVILLLAAAALFLTGLLLKDEGRYALVFHGEEEIGRYALSEDGDYVLRTEEGTNTLCIRNGEAFISAADCPGGDCIRMGRIGKEGGSIVCLPHRLVIRITGGEEEIDVLVR